MGIDLIHSRSVPRSRNTRDLICIGSSFHMFDKNEACFISYIDERISRPGGEVHGTHSVWSLCARSRADIRYISYTTLYGTPCALVRVLYVRGYSRSKVFGSRIVGTCVGSNRARLRSLSSSCSSPHEPWMLETHVETSFLVSAVAVERNARAMKRSLLTPQSSWPLGRSMEVRGFTAAMRCALGPAAR